MACYMLMDNMYFKCKFLNDRGPHFYEEKRVASNKWYMLTRSSTGTQLPFIEVSLSWSALTLPTFTLYFWVHQTLRFRVESQSETPPWRKPHWFLPALMSMLWETKNKSIQFTPSSPFGVYKIPPMKSQQIWIASEMFTIERVLN